MIDFLKDNNLFYDNQFEFRKLHSTNYAIITLVEKTLDTGKFVIGVFFAQKKPLIPLIMTY